jgi:hypothetical protein
MVPLQDTQRKQGGEARAENQSASARKFLATLAASRRPLKNDVKMSDDELLRAFKKMSKAGPGIDGRWLYFAIVVPDGRTIRSVLDDQTILKRLKLGGGAIGFMGLTIFGDPHKGGRAPSIQVYYKPLKKGTAVIEKLERAGRNVAAAVIANLRLIETAIDTEVGE